MNNTNLKLAAVSIVIILITAVFLGCFGSDDKKKKDEESMDKEILTVLLPGDITKTFTLNDLKDMTKLERRVSYQNKMGNYVGEGNYTAVSVQDILGASSSGTAMEPGDTLKISAEDGYYQEYCYYNVYPSTTWYQFQGDFGIAYAKDGKSVPDWENGPMPVFLPEDNQYSAEDSNATSAPGQGYFINPSAGARYVKAAVTLEVTSNSVAEWTVQLNGALNETFTKTDFEILEYYYSSTYTDDKSGLWLGVPLWHIIGRVDDSGPIRGDGAFNDALATNNYKIEIKAGDGYSKEITSGLISKNDEIILADKKNGEPLSDDKHKPVRLAGDSLTSAEMLGNVVEITIKLDSGPTGPIALTVVGKSKDEYDMTMLQSLPATINSGGYKKSTGTTLGPYTYKGVSVKYLLEQTGALASDYGLEVKASDGYTMTYTKAQVEGEFVTYGKSGESQGINSVTMLLAYEEVGEAELSGGPLRLVLVDDDGSLTDSHFWVKQVVMLTIVESVKDWELKLHGINDHTMDRTEFEALATCSYHKMWYNYTDKDDVEHHYEVVPLWILISTIDGIPAPNNFFFFNDFLAEVGYNISVTASDGFSVSFTSRRVARNDSILVAYRDYDKPLTLAAGWPLRIVGQGLSGKESIRNIKYINMTELPQVSEWSFNLTGLTSIKVTQSFFIAMASHHMVWCNITEKGVDKHYQGIPLYYFLGAVDDGDELGHFGFNMTLALLGYTVEVKAADQFTAEFDSIRAARNSSIILAYMNDGEPLNKSEGGPVRLVGNDLSGKERVKNVADITFKNINTVPHGPGILNIEGKKTAYGQYQVNLSFNELKGFPSYSGAGGYKNKFGTITGPFNYTGVNISSLLWLVGGLKDTDSVKITTSDGYNRTFSFSEITGNLETFNSNGDSLGTNQVTPLLAYSEEGNDLIDDGPVKVAFVTNTSGRTITQSKYWLKNVVSIKII